MAPTFKCDVCRLRKVKCDQAKPTCGQCSIKGRPCSYRRQNDIKDDSVPANECKTLQADNTDLSLVATKPTGAGCFQTLNYSWAPRKQIDHAEPTRALCNNSSRLASRWARMVGETSLAASPFSVFGSLPQYIPARASCHPALNAAMEYTIQSYHSWKKQDAMEDRKTMALGTTALATLRQGPESDFESNSNALMASIALHIMAEYLKCSQHDFSQHIHVHHLHAGELSKLLERRWHCGQFNELDSLLIRAISGEEVQRAIFAGERSFLDDLPPVHEIDTGAMVESCSDDASVDIIVIFCHLPRLYRLAKQFDEAPDDMALGHEVLAYGLRLWNWRVKPPPMNITERSSSDVDYNTNFDDFWIHSWFAFDSAFELVLAIRYWISRIHISVILQKLFQDGLCFPDDVDLSTLRAEEIEAAECIMKCWRYALDPRWDLP